MKFIPKLTLLALLLLSSCKKFQDYIMVPAEHRKKRDCVYHNYRTTPHCSQYHLIPVDKPKEKETKVKKKPVDNSQQYQGYFTYSNDQSYAQQDLQ